MARLNVSPARVLDSNAKPISGGTRTVYVAETTTPVTTYSDPALTTPHPQAVPADAAGYFPEIYLPGDAEYKVIDRDSVGATVWTGEKVRPDLTKIAYKTVTDLKASKEKTRGVGSIWEAGGHRYEEVTSGEHLTTAGGVKLKVLPEVGIYHPAAFGDDVVASALASLTNSAALQLDAATVTGIASPVTPNSITSDGTVAIHGEGMHKSRLEFAQGVNGIHRRNVSDIRGAALIKTGSPKTDVAISTGDTVQSYFGLTEDLQITGWRYGIWNRYSLWDEYRNLRLTDNTCHIRLARATYQSGNANPVAGGWNFLDGTGFFNNQVTFDNILANRGECGIWATIMGGTFMNVTTQGQNTDGTANNVLPSGQKGTGLFLDWKGDGSAGWHNIVINHYAEETKIGAYYKDQRYVLVNGMFVQGGTSGNRAEAMLIADASTVEINGLMGQDYFDKRIEAKNGATVYINSQSGPVVATTNYVVDATSRVKMRGIVDKTKYEYRFDTNGQPGRKFVLPVTIPQKAFAELYITAMYNGSSPGIGKYIIGRWNSAAAATVEQITNGTGGVTVACDTSGVITVTATGGFRLEGDMLLNVIGGVDTSGTAITLAGSA